MRKQCWLLEISNSFHLLQDAESSSLFRWVWQINIISKGWIPARQWRPAFSPPHSSNLSLKPTKGSELLGGEGSRNSPKNSPGWYSNSSGESLSFYRHTNTFNQRGAIGNVWRGLDLDYGKEVVFLWFTKPVWLQKESKSVSPCPSASQLLVSNFASSFPQRRRWEKIIRMNTT